MENRPAFLYIAESVFPAGWQAPIHAHADAEEMLIITAGRMQLQLGEQVLTGQTGTVLVYPHAVKHMEWTIGDTPLHLFTLLWQRPLTEEAPTFPPVAFDDRGYLRTTARWMAEMSRDQRPGQQAILDGLLQAMLYAYCSPPALTEDERITRAIRLMQEEMARAIRLADLARAACMSTSHFAHEFRRITGQSPMHYLRERRIETAHWLLTTTRLPLRTIAAQVGFSNEFHFSRIFHELTGQTPSETRNSSRNARCSG